MIIVLLVTSIISLFSAIIVFEVPQFDAIGDLFDYFNLIIDKGIDIYRYFIPPYGQVVISLIIVMNAAYFIYKFVLWFLSKIPMLSIKNEDG